MINLLAPEEKREIRAARRNVVLRRYIVFVGLVTTLVFTTFAFGYYLTYQERQNLQAELESRTGNIKQYAETRATAAQFAKDLATAKLILANEVVFSDLIIDISQTLPPRVVLSELSLSTATFGTEISVKARAKDSNGPIKLKASLEQSALFSNVKIISIDERIINKNDTTLKPQERAYPISFELMAKIEANAGKRKTEGAAR